MMSNDTDCTPEDEPIYEHLVELIGLIERSGRKVKGLHIEFECSDSDSAEQPAQTFWPDGLTTAEVALARDILDVGSDIPFGADPVFELHPVDDEAAETDDFLTLIKDEKVPH